MIFYPPNSPIALSFLNIHIRWYGIIMALAIFVGIVIGYNLIKNKFDSNKASIFLDFTPFVILFSILGARIFYVLGSFSYYINNPKEIILINHGGLSLYGAIIFGIISLVFFAKKYKLDLFNILDVYAVCMPLCQSIGRWGNYINQEAFGKPTQNFIKLYIQPEYRPTIYQDYQYFHPTFLYESILDILIFVIVFYLYKKGHLKKGQIACIYLILYTIIRIITESIRTDSILNIAQIPIATVISIIILIMALFSYHRLNH